MTTTTPLSPTVSLIPELGTRALLEIAASTLPSYPPAKESR